MKYSAYIIATVLLLYPSYGTYAATDIVNDATLGTGLISCWEMDEASGTRADATASNNDLTAMNNPGSGTGKHSNAVDLERSSSQWLEIADASQTGLDFTGDFTASLWFKPETALDGTIIEYNLISKYLSTGNQRSYSFNYTWNSGTPRLQFISSTLGTGASVTVASVNQTLSAATWYHLGFFYDASAGDVEFFVNGSSIGVSAAPGTSIFNGTADFEIGAQNAAFQADGLIDVVAVWNSDLSASMSDLYAAGAGIPCVAAAGGGGGVIRESVWDDE